MNRQLINKNLISINDLKMRMILNNMMNYVFALETMVLDTKKRTDEPIDFTDITKSIQSKFAEQSLASSNLINQKVSEFHNTISQYINQFKELNISEVNDKLGIALRMVADLEKRVIELEKEKTTPQQKEIKQEKPSKPVKKTAKKTTKRGKK